MIWMFHRVTDKPHEESQRAAAIEITPALSSGDKATPSRKATNLPEADDTRSPGTRMPTRLSGSAAETATVSPEDARLRSARSDSTATGRANCSPRKPLTNLP